MITIAVDVVFAIAAFVVVCALLVLLLVAIGTWLTWRENHAKRCASVPSRRRVFCIRCRADLGVITTRAQAETEVALHELLHCSVLMRDEHGTVIGGAR